MNFGVANPWDFAPAQIHPDGSGGLGETCARHQAQLPRKVTV
jgi:hypothetical protein